MKILLEEDLPYSKIYSGQLYNIIGLNNLNISYDLKCKFLLAMKGFGRASLVFPERFDSL